MGTRTTRRQGRPCALTYLPGHEVAPGADTDAGWAFGVTPEGNVSIVLAPRANRYLGLTPQQWVEMVNRIADELAAPIDRAKDRGPHPAIKAQFISSLARAPQPSGRTG